MSFRIEITENISKIGIEDIVLDRGVLQFILKDQTKCSVFVQSNKHSVQKLCKDIRNKLFKKLHKTMVDSKLIERGLSDIEDQIITGRDEIFASSTAFKDNDTDHATSEFNIKFYEEVSKLRSQFKETSEPYREWQSKVSEKYENLERVFKKHYPEAWIFLEFCLSIKSILNIMDFTLPFMGVLVAAPSSLKTMVIQLFRKYPLTFYTDSFTSSSLVSHNAALSEEQLQKIDMLPKIKDKLVLTPELAPLLTGNEIELQKVLGIFTRVLDGHGLENDSGAHGHRKYSDTMFVWLGAVVEIPFRVWKLLGALGHKIYFLRPALKKKTVKDLERFIKSNNFSSINKEIEDSLLDYLKTFDAAPEKDGIVKLENGIVKIRWKEEAEEQEQVMAIRYISQLANLLASLRGTVYISQSKSIRNKISYNNDDNDLSETHPYPHQQQQQHYQLDGQDYDTDFPTIEDASRAAVLLRNLAIGHAVSKGRDFLIREDVSIVIKVALSTAPIRRVKLLDLLLKSDNAELTTSQITTHLSVSQPIATKTMREFEALGIADISAVSSYNNSELQIKLKSEFEWFKTDAFLELKEDFVPYEKKNNENDNFDSQSVVDSSFTEDNNDNHVVKNDNTDNPISQNKDLLSSLESKEKHSINSDTVETVGPCDNNKDCHIFKDNLPPETQQKNDVLDNCMNQSESSNENHDLQSSTIQNHNESLEHQFSLSSTSDDHDIEKNSVCLSGSNSLERVTVSHETKEEEGNQSPFQIPPNIKEGDGLRYIAFKEILRAIKENQGSWIALNYSIEIACKNNESVRSYLNGKLTPRENRNVRDLVPNIIRHTNIEVIKKKSQTLVKWSEKSEDSSTNIKEDKIV